MVATVWSESRDLDLEFLIDTGADFTILSPIDSLRLFGSAYLNFEFSAQDGLEVTGLGATPTVVRFIDAALKFIATDGTLIELAFPVAIPEPHPRLPSPRGNWQMPSLLGRDALDFFDLAISYHPPTVTLTEVGGAGA